MSISLRLTRPNQGSENESILSKIGDTPLFRLERIDREFPNVSIYAKAEWLNPGGSVKDRPALRMILAAEASGALRAGKTILDATSGNTGIALAMIGAARGYDVHLTIPANASAERIRILRAYGATLTLTDPGLGTDGAIEMACSVASAQPDRYAYLDQYNNADNWKAHYDSTAPEIWEQTAGCVSHFVGALGTSGSFVGTSRRLQEFNPAIECISVQPDTPFHGMEGMKHMASAIVPGIYDPAVADDNVAVKTEDAHLAVKRLIREEGLLIGVSSGAALMGCLDVARGLPPGRPAMIVTIFPDNGEKYLSERFWDDVPRGDGMIRLDDTLRQDIRRHAEHTYPHECCGALFGRSGDDTKDVVATAPIDNRRDGDTARRRFLISADDYRALDRTARARGLDILGFYHSHPDHPARPSEYDRDHALPWYSYVIVSVEDGRGGDLTSWVLDNDRTRFFPERLA